MINYKIVSSGSHFKILFFKFSENFAKKVVSYVYIYVWGT